ncbi:MAG: type III-B CRISPR module RAMP protein Cmr6 [Candidatus Desantisbacteria bacterium]
MRRPLHKDIDPQLSPSPDSHKGLWYERFFDQYDDNDWRIIKEDPKQHISDGKKTWIQTVTGNKCGDKAAIEAAITRQYKLCIALGGEICVMQADWHFATGLGNPHPVENGFAWHPTLGVPYLTGAAVKGLVRAWIEEWEEEQDGKEEKLHRWFGSEDKDPTKCKLDSQSGNFIFFDALPIAPVTLKMDVITPHMGKWYDKGGEPPKPDGSNVPADWHSPVPVFFLVADKPQLLFAVASRVDVDKEETKTELAKIMEVLNNALEWLGAGAKTAVGYGHMTEDPERLKTLEDKMNEETRQIAEEEAVKQMTPFEKELHILIKANCDSNQKDYVILLKALESEKWTDTDTKNLVAQKIKGLMKIDKVWQETSKAKKPERDWDYQRTLKVLKYLN